MQIATDITSTSQIQNRAVDAPASRLDAVRILLVDDRPDKALALRSVVEELGHDLVIATSAKEGLRHLLNSQFQLLLLDVEMPDMNGLEMARLVRERKSTTDLPIIFVSAIEHDDARLEQAYTLGAFDFIQLPERRAVLRAKISNALQGQHAAEKLARALQKSADNLVATEERLRLLFENAKDLAIIFADKKGTILDWSCGAETCFGWSEKEIVGQSLSVLFTPQDVVERVPEKKLFEALNPETPFDERWLLRKDGTRFWATTRFLALTQPALAGYALVLRDTTERRRVEQDLRIRSEVLATMAESVCVVDENLTIHYCNAAAERTFGYAPGELVGMKVTLLNDHLPNEDDSRVETLLSHLQEHRSWEGEWKNRKRDGTSFTTYVRLTLLEYKGAIWYVCVQQDLTAWNEARAELLRSKHELESRVEERTTELKQLVEDLQTVAYSISHDVKTPLRAIAGYAEAIIEDYATTVPAPALAHMRKIQGAAQRLEIFVKDVLTQSHTIAAHASLRRVDIGQILHDLLQQDLALQPSVADISIAEPMLPVIADPALLAQVLRNLLANAVKFVPAGTKPKVHLSAEEVAGGVRISVVDNGIGIPTTDQARIFEMFERAEANGTYEGTGLGLAIARRAVEKMGGTIGVQSTPGVGSCFWVCLRKA